MSKSLGNTALVDEVVQRVRPVELRYYLVAPHYRSTIEFTDAALAEAASAYRRIESFVRRAAERVGRATPGAPVLCAEFTARDGRRPRHAGRRSPSIHDAGARGQHRAGRRATTPPSPARSAPCARCSASSASTRSTRSGPTAAGDDRLARATDGLVALALEQRQAARARKDFAAADAIRDQLTALGVVVEDTPQGPRWELSR